MRELARLWVFPTMLVAAVGATAVAIDAGAPPAAAVFGLYLLMMPMVAGLERWLPHRPEWNEGRGDRLTDALYLPTTWGLGALLSPAFAAVAVAVEGALSRSVGATSWPEHWPLALQVALACVVAEFFDYWGHRVMHKFDWLWRLHATHHQPGRVYFLNGTRAHPLEVALRFGFIGVIPLAILGVEGRVLALTAIAALCADVYQHANIAIRLGPLSWIYSIGDDDTLKAWPRDATEPAASIPIIGLPLCIEARGRRIWVGCQDSSIGVYEHTPAKR